MRTLLKLGVSGKILLAFFLLSGGNSLGQFKEGKIVETITISSPNGLIQRMIDERFQTVRTVRYVKGPMIREYTKNTNGYSVRILNRETGQKITLAKINEEKWYAKGEVVQPTRVDEVEIISEGETRVIHGYTCQKYTVKGPRGSEGSVYACGELDFPYFSGFYGNEISGYPLSADLEVSFMGFRVYVRYNVAIIREMPVETTLFDMSVPDGYTQTTEKEINEKLYGKK